MVQLPQVRQREATSSQCGDSRLSASSWGRPWRHGAAHLVGRPGDRRAARRIVASSAARLGTSASTSAPAGVPTRTRKRWPVGVDELGHRQVEPGLDAGTAAHRRAEAGRARLSALDRDDERAVAPSTVDRVDVVAAGQHPVQDADRAHVARAHAEQGVPGRSAALAGRHAAGRPVRRPQPRPRRVEHGLP